MTPIEKNMVRVTDVDKNVLAPTYMRRARGLVKAGRAEWTSPEMDEICLFRPPAAFNMEDKMHNNPDTTDVSEKVTGENTELTREEFDQIFRQNDEDHVENVPPTYTIEYILGRIEKIHDETSHIYEALDSFRNFTVNISPIGGTGDATRANAMVEVVKCREVTLQKELDFLEKMYNDLKAAEKMPSHKEQLVMEFVSQATLPPQVRVEMFEKYLNSID